MKNCQCGRPISDNKIACQKCASGVPTGPGVLEILNVGAGDVKITFDKGDLQETIRARRIVTDMLRRGYALVVEVERDGQTAYERVKAFDEARGQYIIADFDPVAADRSDREEAETGPVLATNAEVEAATAGLSCECGKPLRHRGACKGVPRRATRNIPMEKAKATAIGRSSGG